MAFTSDHADVTLKMKYMGQDVIFSRPFRLEGAVFLTADAVNVGEAYWNHVSEAWRDLAPSTGELIFQSVVVEEIEGSLSFGEYVIPLIERTGTRSLSGLGEALPSFMAASVKLAVGTRVTRPGGVRVPFLLEGDVADQTLVGTYITLLNALMDVYVAPLSLGIPVATGVMHTAVYGKGNSDPAVFTFQDIVGYVVDLNVSTQRSRRIGHGS